MKEHFPIQVVLSLGWVTSGSDLLVKLPFLGPAGAATSKDRHVERARRRAPKLRLLPPAQQEVRAVCKDDKMADVCLGVGWHASVAVCRPVRHNAHSGDDAVYTL